MFFFVIFAPSWSIRLQETLDELIWFCPPALETLTHAVIGCALAVHRELGPGFLESIYRAAMAIEMSAKGVPFEVERPVVVDYRGHPIGGQRVDLLVGG